MTKVSELTKQFVERCLNRLTTQVSDIFFTHNHTFTNNIVELDPIVSKFSLKPTTAVPDVLFDYGNEIHGLLDGCNVLFMFHEKPIQSEKCVITLKDNDKFVSVFSNKHNMIKKSLEPQIGVYVICKNESKFIKRMYDSIESADFISIVDTGSTDDTYDILKHLVEERCVHYGHEEDVSYQYVDNNLVCVSDGHFTAKRLTINPWRFDDARNAAISVLPTSLDMCVSIDADEELAKHSIENLKFLITNWFKTEGYLPTKVIHSFSTVWDWETSAPKSISNHLHERVHSRNDYTWKLPVHEVLKCNKEERIKYEVNGIKIVQKPDLSKSRSYLEPLKQSINEDRNNWKLWSFYATELVNAGRYEESKEAINNALLCDNADKQYLYYQLANISTNYDDKLKYLSLSIIGTPVREYYYNLAMLHFEFNNISQCLVYYQLALDVKTETVGYMRNEYCWIDKFEHDFHRIREKAYG